MDLTENVAVVILNYNGKDYLEKFLPSVTQHSGAAEIIIADNGSTDDSIAFLKQEYPQVRRIEITENLGFCGGYNYALKQVEKAYYVLLNSDVAVTENWLNPLLMLFQKYPKVAACQPKIRAYHQQEMLEHAGAAGGFIDILGYPFARGRIFDAVEADKAQYDDEVEIFWATGACMCIKADLYHQTGGLDEAFFAHMEEIDLCWRLKNAGFQIYYTGQSHVFHVGGGTLNKENPRKTFLNFRNGLFLLCKNLPSHLLFLIIFLRLILDGVAGVRFILLGEFGNFWAVLRAHFAFYAKVPLMLKRRKAIKTKPFPFQQVYPKPLIFAHFLWKKTKFNQLNFN